VLLDCGEPIPESKEKVTDFLNGIIDPTMHAAIVFVNGAMTKLNDFDVCQQYYLSSLVASTATQKASSKNRRSVASTNTTKGKGAKGGRGSPSKKVIDKYYSDAEWKK